MKATLMHYKKINNNIYWVVFENEAIFGEIFKEVDGYFYFEFNPKLTGCVPAHILREVADKIDEMNESWNKEINNYFDEKH